MFCSVYVNDDVVFEVCHDQTMVCVVHVADDVFSSFFSIYVDDVVISEKCHNQTTFFT